MPAEVIVVVIAVVAEVLSRSQEIRKKKLHIFNQVLN
jgi:hypothetical protein